MGVETGLQLRILRGNQQGLVISLRERNYLLGRAVSHEDFGPGRLYFHDPSVASLQAIMRWNEFAGHYVISHQTNQSNTWIAGLPLTRGTPRDLKPGSRLKMGNLVAVVERLAPPSEPAPEAAPPPSCEPEPAVATARAEHFVDSSWFTTRTYKVREGEVLHGPVAEFFADGQLKRLSHYSQGKLSQTHHQLLLEQGVAVGRVVSDVSECVFSNGHESVVTNLDGEVDFFETEANWDEWVRKWIRQICGQSAVNLI